MVGAACRQHTLTQHEYMYVSAAETSLRDRIATLYTKVGTVHNGDRVEVLEKQKRFLRVRTDGGQEGWIEQRSLVPQAIYDGFQQLAKESATGAIQAHGSTRAELNMHLTPSRDGEHLYLLKDGEKLEILKRTTTDKNAPKPAPSVTPSKPTPGSNGGTKGVPQKSATSSQSSATSPNPGGAKLTAAATPLKTAVPPAASSKPAEPPKPPAMEDWYLVRNSAGRVGWVLMRMIDLDVPLDIAQYAEGQRVIGYFVLNTVQEDDKPVPQYLVLLNQPKDGLPWDYNQFRVFTRNRAKHRYETAYRERELEGYLPVKTGHEAFEKEGDLPTFTIRKKKGDQLVETTYKLNGPIVRRVPTPEEEAAARAKHEAEVAARQKSLEAARARRSAAHSRPSSSPHRRHKHH